MSRTKIVATLGPASNSQEVVNELVRAGMSVARLNCSHGSEAEQRQRIEWVRTASAECGRAVGVLLDLQGPKIRTGALAGGHSVELRSGSSFVITNRDVPGDASCVSTSYRALPTDVQPGDRILLSDGLIELRVEEAGDTDVTTTVVDGGKLKERQGINLPGVKISAAGVTEKDIEDLNFGLANDVDYVAISFVRSAADVREVKDLIAAQGKDTPVVAKIEKPEALAALLEILEVADGVMVARGDLGVELEPQKVPLAQKRIIREANRRAIPVITATQMLESMIVHPRPTRAEASDVANAILDGSDAVMLSGETAMGEYPVESVETMVRIAREVEREGSEHRYRDRRSGTLMRAPSSIPEAVGGAVDAVAANLEQVSAVWVFTQSGSTARIISKRRMMVPIVAFTPRLATYHRMAMLWGVIPIRTPAATSRRELEDDVLPLAVAAGVAQHGDTVIITGSHPFDAAAPTNFLKIQKLG